MAAYRGNPILRVSTEFWQIVHDIRIETNKTSAQITAQIAKGLK